MKTERPTAIYHWPYSLLNGTIIFLVVTFSLTLSTNPGGSGDWLDNLASLPFFAFLAAIPTVLIVIFSVIYHRIIYWLLKKRVYKQRYWMGLFLLPAAAVIGLELYEPSAQTKADSLLVAGRLASLPTDVTEIEFSTWSGIFTGAQFLKFRASAEAIEEFTLGSTSISGSEVKYYTEESPRLPYPKNIDLNWAFTTRELESNWTTTTRHTMTLRNGTLAHCETKAVDMRCPQTTKNITGAKSSSMTAKTSYIFI